MPDRPLVVTLPHELAGEASIFVRELAKDIAEGGLKESKACQEAMARYRVALARGYLQLLPFERRLGLVNLFFLAHFCDLKRIVAEGFPKAGSDRYRVFPSLRAFFNTLFDEMKRGFGKVPPQQIQSHLGGDFSFALLETLANDHIFLTEETVWNLNFDALLGNSLLYRIDGPTYRTLEETVAEIFRVRLLRGERTYREAAAAAGLSLSVSEKIPSWKIVYNDRCRGLALGEHRDIMEAFSASKPLRKSADAAGGEGTLIREMESLIRDVKRAEYVECWAGSVHHLQAGIDRAEQDELAYRGELFRFTMDGEPYPSSRRAAILIGDVRKFTSVAEGPFSERELSRELYDLFDPVAAIVERLGGRVDKFLGDGFIITFGVPRHHPQPCLSALRAAVLIQKYLSNRREKGKTPFTMGLALHTGLVSLAHFFRDRSVKEDTVIGRHVNLTARLSSAREIADAQVDPADFRHLVDSIDDPAERELVERSFRTPAQRVIAGVGVDRTGQIANRGIATTREMIEGILRERGEQVVEGENPPGFEDDILQSAIGFSFVGEANLRGVPTTVPVFSVTYT
jgi:class 3 adenylate cyclase